MSTLEDCLTLPTLKFPERRSTFFCVLDGIQEEEYAVAVLDKGLALKLPFVLTKDIVTVVRETCDPYKPSKENAVALYEWLCENITYGKKKRGDKGYRNSSETFCDREGVCGEMSMLYLAMVRSIGIRGSYAEVDVDYNQEHVHHACAMIDLEGNHGPTTLVDPVYQQYDLQHLTFTPLTDKQLLRKLNSPTSIFF